MTHGNSAIGDDKEVNIKLGFWIWSIILAFVLGGSVLAYKLDIAAIEAKTNAAITCESKALEKTVGETYARKDLVIDKFEMILKRLDKIDRKLGM